MSANIDLFIYTQGSGHQFQVMPIFKAFNCECEVKLSVSWLFTALD